MHKSLKRRKPPAESHQEMQGELPYDNLLATPLQNLGDLPSRCHARALRNVRREAIIKGITINSTASIASLRIYKQVSDPKARDAMQFLILHRAFWGTD